VYAQRAARRQNRAHALFWSIRVEGQNNYSATEIGYKSVPCAGAGRGWWGA